MSNSLRIFVTALAFLAVLAGVGPARAQSAAPDPIAEARDRFTKASTPTDKSAAGLKLAPLLVAAGRKKEALDTYQELALSADNAVRTAGVAGLIDLYAQHKDVSLDDVFQRCLVVARQRPEFRFTQQAASQLHAVAQKREETPKLMTLADAEVKKNAQDATGRAVRAHFHYVAGEYALAARVYEEARKLDSKDAALRAQLAQSYEYAGELENAAGLYEEIVAEEKAQNPSTCYRAASICARLGNEPKAQRYLGQYLERTPGGNPASDASRHYHAGIIFSEMGKVDAAVSELRQAVQLAADLKGKGNQEAYQYQLVTVLANGGRAKEAETECRNALDAGVGGNYRAALEQQLSRLLTVRGAAGAAAELEREAAALRELPDKTGSARWRAEMAAALYEDAGYYRKALAVQEMLLGLVEDPKPVQAKVEWLRVTVRNGEREMAAVLSAPDLLWKKADPSDKDVIWLAFRNRLVRLDQRAEGRKEFSEFFGYAEWTPLCMEFQPDRVWLGTDRGAFAFDRKQQSWRRYALGGSLLEARVEQIREGWGGRVKFTVAADGGTQTYTLQPEGETWK